MIKDTTIDEALNLNKKTPNHDENSKEVTAMETIVNQIKVRCIF